MVGLSRLLFGIAAVIIAGLGGFAAYEYNEVRSKDRRQIEQAERELQLTTARFEKELSEKESLLQRAQQVNDQHQKTITEQESTIKENVRVIAEHERQISLLTDYIHFLNVNKRVAKIEVLGKEEVTLSDDFGERKSARWRLRFQEFDQSGKPVDAPLNGVIIGNIVKIEAFTIQWNYSNPDLDVEHEHSLVFIRRLYGSEEPANRATFLIDEKGKMPKAYGTDLSDEVSELVEEFWDIANDPQRREAEGISFIGLQAPGIELREGMTYELEVRQSGAPILKAVDGSSN